MFVVMLTAVETVGLVRDITVIVFLALAFLVLFVGSAMAIVLYRRSSRILGRADRAINAMESTMESIEDAADATRSAASAVRNGLGSGFGVSNILRSVAGSFIGRSDKGRDDRRRNDRRRSRDD